MTKQEVVAPGVLTRREWAARIKGKWSKAGGDMLASIFEIGRDLVDAKEGPNKLPHGEFKKLIGNARQGGELPFNYRVANMYMAVARDERLSKVKTFSLLPPHYATLYKVTRLDDDTLEKCLAEGVISPTATYAEINKELRLSRVAADEAEVLKLEPRPGKYRTIVIDPAWDYDNLSLGARAKADYAKQNLESLRTLDLRQWAEPECHLYCWATNNYLYEAMKLVEGWGFQYRLVLVWVKTGAFGMGSYFRHSHEPCVFATLGDTTTKAAAASIATHFTAPRGEHSEKPEEFYEIVRKASYAPYGEGNQREARKDFANLFQIKGAETVVA